MPRKKKAQDKDILKIILGVIIKVGATEFSLEDLKKETGLSPATLLQRFGSKTNILYKAIELANNDSKKQLIERPIVSTSPLQEIINIYLELSASFSRPQDIAGGLDIIKLDITDKKLNAATRTYFAIRRKKIESLIILAQKKGEIARDINVSEMVWNLESLWQGSIMLWALIGKGHLKTWLKRRFLSFLKVMRVKD